MRIGSNYNSNILLSLTTSLKQISNNQPGSSGEMKLPDSISDHRANISIIISQPATTTKHISVEIAESVTETSCELSLSALLLYWLADQSEASEASPKNCAVLIGLN